MIRLSVLVTLCLFPTAHSFPQGAPAEACESLLPRHYGTEPKDAEQSPFSFLASSSHYHYRMDGIQGNHFHSSRKGILKISILLALEWIIEIASFWSPQEMK
ncbi:hypothetical protein AVEN_143767-1 [Araneus ventricosus]|uniref:Uncharacterized protein n=1 Tax=Araneus ventricosus TaxID=182803 RepID=A0A4Y2ANP0_ARAVE|nr:hypothetical protein AVEN_143767-1 [Araneus ventricosus]